jgi:glycosyltransferase involved in cell wall biosynthesis
MNSTTEIIHDARLSNVRNLCDLTIVVPCLNEEENIEAILKDIYTVVKDEAFTSEIIVVDDLSDDKTFRLATSWAVSHADRISTKVIVRNLRRRGYGAVVRYGAAHGVGRYCIFVSADAVDPIRLIPELYKEMENGAVLAQCSRYLKPGDDKTIPFKYKFCQFFFRAAVRVALGQHIPDSTYAFKMFRRQEALGLGLSQNRFSISPEITFKSILTGGDIRYLPGAQGVRSRGVSKFKFHKEGIGFGYCLLRAALHRAGAIYWF